MRLELIKNRNNYIIIIKNFLYRDRISKQQKQFQVSPTSPFCCGSNADSSQIKKEPTGLFERKMTGTSFKVSHLTFMKCFQSLSLLRSEILKREKTKLVWAICLIHAELVPFMSNNGQ